MQSSLPMHQSRRCGARTRSGKPCQSPSVTGRARCRMHGGAAGTGAPKGNSNARKHGHHGADAIRARRYVSALLRLARAELSDIDENRSPLGT
jgi:hypothetical protein